MTESSRPGRVLREPPGRCPECGGSLARGGLALSCRDCDWRSSIEHTARWLGLDVEDDDGVLATDGGIETSGGNRPTSHSDRFEAEYRGELITIWNHLSVTKQHYVTAGQIETEYEISAGDGPGNRSPEYITPEMDDQLRFLDVYPEAEVVDPHDEEVTLV